MFKILEINIHTIRSYFGIINFRDDLIYVIFVDTVTHELTCQRHYRLTLNGNHIPRIYHPPGTNKVVHHDHKGHMLTFIALLGLFSQTFIIYVDNIYIWEIGQNTFHIFSNYSTRKDSKVEKKNSHELFKLSHRQYLGVNTH